MDPLELKAEEAAQRRAVELEPSCAAHWAGLANCLRRQQRLEEAEICSRRALELDSSQVDHWTGLAGALIGQGKYDRAIEAYQAALKIDSASGKCWWYLGIALQLVNRIDAAHAAFERCLDVHPEHVEARLSLAALHRDHRNLTAALKLLEGVLSRDPGNSEALFQLALVKRDLWQLAEADSLVSQALARDPQHADAWTLLGLIRLGQARQQDALDAHRQAIALGPSAARHSRLLMSLHYADEASPEILLSTHQAWNSLYGAPTHRLRRVPQRSLGGRPLRLGFVMAEMGLQPFTSMVLPAIEALDKSRCSVVFYCDSNSPDANIARLKTGVELWHATAGWPAEKVAEQIEHDEIDVLIDLSGHTGDRLSVFAMKPAPIQVSWFGYVGTTGLAAMDYLLADRFHVRPGEEGFYAEKILRMPHGYACYRPPADLPGVSPTPAISNGFVTFGCFNNPAKYSRFIWRAWAEILQRVPTAKLLLKSGGLDQPELQHSLRERMEQLGVTGDRLEFAGFTSQLNHLAAYGRVDIALDTQPYSGGLTTCEALWMGMPVITWPGSIFASRHASSHLTNAGCGEFVARDRDHYVEMAVEWAARATQLQSARFDIRERLRESPLCDVNRYAQYFLQRIAAIALGET